MPIPLLKWHLLLRLRHILRVGHTLDLQALGDGQNVLVVNHGILWPAFRGFRGINIRTFAVVSFARRRSACIYIHLRVHDSSTVHNQILTFLDLFDVQTCAVGRKLRFVGILGLKFVVDDSGGHLRASLQLRGILF